MNQSQSQPQPEPFDLLNYQQYADKLLWVKDEDRQISHFVFNQAQQQYNTDKTSHDIILKARKLGFSTFKLGEYFHETVTVPNTVFVVISHEGLATRRLLRIIKLFYEKLSPQFKPEILYNSTYEMFFPKLNSTIFVGTAGAKSFGRGDTINLLHCSEVAFWEDAENLMLGLKESIPQSGKITLESTPNGMGGYFWEEWQKAKTGIGKYKSHFYPWWFKDKYFIPGVNLSDIALLTKEEYNFIENRGLTAGQILWRREKIEDIGATKFLQEYPSDDISCFLSDTRRIFEQDILERQKCFLQEPRKAELTVNGVCFV